MVRTRLENFVAGHVFPFLVVKMWTTYSKVGIVSVYGNWEHAESQPEIVRIRSFGYVSRFGIQLLLYGVLVNLTDNMAK